jgi:type VI secretion system secreted protein Hcp
MFLSLDGVTGETSDVDHKGCIDVKSWSWGMQSPSDVMTGQPISRVKVNNLKIVKLVDKSSPTLIQYLRNNTMMKKGCLLIRKAGGTPFTFYEIHLEKVRLTELITSSQDTDIVESVSLSFAKATFKYTPQSSTGGPASGKTEYTVDAYDDD